MYALTKEGTFLLAVGGGQTPEKDAVQTGALD